MIKFRKKITALSLAVVMLLSLTSCGKNNSKTTENESTEETTGIEVSNTEPTTEAPDVDLDSPEAKAEQEKFDKWLWDSYVEAVNSDSITLNYSLSKPEEVGITPTDATYGDVDFSEEANEKTKKEVQDCLKEMEAFDYSLLSEEQKHTYDVIYEMEKVAEKSYDYLYLSEPFAYTSGLQSNLPIALAEYTFYDRQDIEDYLTLLELTPDYFNSCLEFEKIKSQKGYFMSTHSANEVIRQCSEFIASPEENLLIETFEDRIREFEGLTEEEIQEYITRNHDAVINYIIPAYKSTIETFKRLKNTGDNDLGVCYYENGKEYYAYLLEDYVGTDKTPEEVIALLDKAIEDNMSEMYSKAFGNYNEYEAYIQAAENGDLYEELDYRETVEFFENAVDDRFPEIPEIEFKVTPVHKSLENIVSPAFFMTPPIDAYENNSIYVNKGSSDNNSLWSTLAHEGVPGHMYQFVYYLSSDPEPIRSVMDFGGYQEGWATYVEMMSFEYYDKYEYPSYANFEEINHKLNLLVSARVEIGVNYEGWTVEDTEKYLTENGFNAEVAKDIIDYVVAEPANYQMYCMGWLEFEELKEHAKEELGDKFDEKEFHKAVLDAGPCQFYVLRKEVDKYIARVK